MVRSPHVEAQLSPAAEARHQRRRRHRAGACHRHRRPVRRGLHPRALRLVGVRGLGGVRRRAANTARKRSSSYTGVPAEEIRGAARLYATGGNGAIYYGLGVTEHSQGSTTVMAIANLAMATGNIGRPGVGVNPLRGQNNVQGSCDMGSFPHELPGYRHISDDATRDIFEKPVGRDARQRAGPAHPQHARRRRRRHVQGHLHPGRGHPAVRPRHQACRRPASPRWNASSCTTSSSTRPRTTRMSSCPARPSSRRTAPSPMPSAASTACAR